MADPMEALGGTLEIPTDPGPRDSHSRTALHRRSEG
jgi:hypothetical protein